MVHIGRKCFERMIRDHTKNMPDMLDIFDIPSNVNALKCIHDVDLYTFNGTICNEFCLVGNLTAVSYVWEHADMFWAAISGDLSIVKFLAFKGIPIDTYLYECPLVRRHENVMRYLEGEDD